MQTTTPSPQALTRDGQPASRYRWVMLAACSLTSLLVFAMPALSLPVLFPEIAADLDLSIVQVGVIWAVSSLTGVLVVLVGGIIGDRFGTRRTLIVACLLSGVFGALRGLAGTYFSFIAASFLLGMIQPAIPVNLHKIAGEWFPRRQLGLATAVISSGFAMGLMLGSLLSATVFSPALGGWRGVLLMYGAVAIVVGGLWVVVHPGQMLDAAGRPGIWVTLRDNFTHVARIEDLVLVGLGAMGFWACTRGFVGYLPTYLRDAGWSGARADQALSLFYAVSLFAAIPLALLTDRYRRRKEFLVLATLMMAAGVALMAVAEGSLIWMSVVVGGIIFDGFMAVFMATVLEIEGVGVKYAGTALGFAAMLREIGGIFSPPVGNSLTTYGANMPFLFWGFSGVLGAVAFSLYLRQR